ncbi:MAG: ACT domain-containing protein [Firmicutes bacterium]|nr:ACT domain-containing protein [Bacillota bacterium]
MAGAKEKKYYLVDAALLPEIFLKVMAAKALLETGEADTVGKAVARVGISRSAFYKYKDAVSPFRDFRGRDIVTFHVLLRDRPGALSSVLTIFAGMSANILTINQSIPINGAAVVAISAETSAMRVSMDEFTRRLGAEPDVIKIEILAG